MSIQSSINQSIAVAGAFKAMRAKNSTAAPTAAARTGPAMQSKPDDQAKSVEALRSAKLQAQSKKALKRAVSEYIVKWREYGKK